MTPYLLGLAVLAALAAACTAGGAWACVHGLARRLGRDA